MASFFYSAFGLSLCADQSLPALIALSETTSVDVRIHLGTIPLEFHCECYNRITIPAWYSSSSEDTLAPPGLTVWRPGGGWYFLRYSDATEFLVDPTGSEVWATWASSSTLADAATYLLGPILGLVLRLRGLVCLHASAVSFGDRAVALVGPPGAGKSTLAAAFARRGAFVLADDIAALQPNDDAFLIRPAYPQLRLWPESVHALYGDEEALPLLTPTWEKRGLDLSQPGYQFASCPFPLAAIYLLGERREENAPCVEPVPEAGRLATLVQNTYMNYLLDREMRAAEFAVLGRLLKTTPLRRVVSHSNAAHLGELCDVILDDFHRRLT
jgi:hypothetical protein